MTSMPTTVDGLSEILTTLTDACAEFGQTDAVFRAIITVSRNAAEAVAAALDSISAAAAKVTAAAITTDEARTMLAPANGQTIFRAAEADRLLAAFSSKDSELSQLDTGSALPATFMSPATGSSREWSPR